MLHHARKYVFRLQRVLRTSLPFDFPYKRNDWTSAGR